MDPFKPSPQTPKKRMVSGAASSDFASETRYQAQNYVYGPSQDRESYPRDPADEIMEQEDLSAANRKSIPPNSCGRCLARAHSLWGATADIATGPRMAEKLLLEIQYECARNDVDLPWKLIAQRLNFGSSSGAVHHLLWRMRQQLIAEGHAVPPPVGLGGRHTASQDPDVEGVVRKPEDRSVFSVTRAVGWNDSHGHKLNLTDTVNAPDIETPKGKKANRAAFFNDDSDSPELDDCTRVALRSRLGATKNTYTSPESGGDKNETHVDEDDPFSDFHECKAETDEDDGDGTVDEMEAIVGDRMPLGNIACQVDDDAADTKAHVKARQLSGTQKTNSDPFESSFGAREPQVASMHGPMLIGYGDDLSLDHVSARRITPRASSHSMYSGSTAAQRAADLGYGGTIQSLFSQAFTHFHTPGSVAPFQASRSEDPPTEVEEGSPTPTAKTYRNGAAQKKSAVLPATPTPIRKKWAGTCHSPMPSSFEPDVEAESTPRPTAKSLSSGASGTATTSSLGFRRPSASHRVVSAAKRDTPKRLNDDDELFNSFADMGFRGSG